MEKHSNAVTTLLSLHALPRVAFPIPNFLLVDASKVVKTASSNTKTSFFMNETKAIILQVWATAYSVASSSVIMRF